MCYGPAPVEGRSGRLVPLTAALAIGVLSTGLTPSVGGADTAGHAPDAGGSASVERSSRRCSQLYASESALVRAQKRAGTAGGALHRLATAGGRHARRSTAIVTRSLAASQARVAGIAALSVPPRRVRPARGHPRSRVVRRGGERHRQPRTGRPPRISGSRRRRWLRRTGCGDFAPISHSDGASWTPRELLLAQRTAGLLAAVARAHVDSLGDQPRQDGRGAPAGRASRAGPRARHGRRHDSACSSDGRAAGGRRQRRAVQRRRGAGGFCRRMRRTEQRRTPSSSTRWPTTSSDGLRAGCPAGIGVMAVDPSVIPLGTRVFVPGYGPAVAADVGSAVKGLMIDLWMPTTARARAWGRRTVTITVYG